jgi:hypothetical protein
MPIQIKNYRVTLFNASKNYDNLGRCFTTAQIKLDSDAMRAWLVFYDSDKTDTVPTNRYANDPAGEITVFIPKDQYIQHLDLLRNEGPVFFFENDSDSKGASLRTAEEEAGDGDL